MDNERILVAVDFGATSARAFDAAVELASRLGAGLDLVHVIPPIPLEADAAGSSPPYVDSASDELAKLCAAAAKRGVEARSHLRQETVVFALLEAIAELEPKLVVVGSHGRRGVARALLGSISESLARHSRVPVLIVPSPERAAVAARSAWSCLDCGHILGNSEAHARCTRCGRMPARWSSAPITEGPADVGAPAIGEAVAADLEAVQTGGGGSGGGGFFATSPAGGDRTEANAELRVRY